jgi:hypothetical protein
LDSIEISDTVPFNSTIKSDRKVEPRINKL